VALAALLAPGLALAAQYPGAEGYYPPGYDPSKYPANYNPYHIISDDNWRAGQSMTQADIQAFLETQNGVLKSYACAEGGPNGAHSQVVKPASQIIAEAAAYWNVNPKLVIATLEKEQSLITQPWHVATATHPYGTDYHLTYAMGAGVYSGSPDNHPGFGDQVWTGTQKLGSQPTVTTSPYYWIPGRAKSVYSYPSASQLDIVPMNQPTWNSYAYTPYFPQYSVWKYYNQWFGDPLAYPGKRPIYRFYNKVNGSHFYTASEAERYTVIQKWSSTYQFEGAAYSIEATAPAMNTPLYRFYNKKNGSHFYTASADEANTVIARWPSIYLFEGPVYNVSMTPEGCSPVYRFYNVRSKSHFYTVSLDEANSVILKWPNIYSFEGIAYYVALSR
jgi:hypothetical protein